MLTGLSWFNNELHHLTNEIRPSPLAFWSKLLIVEMYYYHLASGLWNAPVMPASFQVVRACLPKMHSPKHLDWQAQREGYKSSEPWRYSSSSVEVSSIQFRADSFSWFVPQSTWHYQSRPYFGSQSWRIQFLPFCSMLESPVSYLSPFTKH